MARSRLLPSLFLLFLFAATDLAAANRRVAGKVNFVAKRGQNTKRAETLVRLDPLGDSKRLKPAAVAFQMPTRAKTLTPHILAVPVGSSVQFPNQDPIAHNIFSLSATNPFDLGLYRMGPGKTEKFEKPGVVNVYCNVHPGMSAVIHVMDTPYWTFTDEMGNFALDEIPPGSYRLTAWNEQGSAAPVQIEVTASDVSGETTLTIDSSSARTAGHLNKFGKPYKTSRSKDY